MSDKVQMIPIERIRIINPRVRERKKFEVIVQSIRNLGLKKPIQVSLRSTGESDEPGYDLVCGQGRLEAFVAIGHKEIPAVVIEVSKEDRLLRSLVENMARRQTRPLELISEIERLKNKGYGNCEIARKLDISDTTVSGLLSLSQAGEERLLEAAIVGKIPLCVAVDISRTDSVETQRELLKAYESRQLNYLSIRTVKRLIDQRRFFGKQRGVGARNSRKGRTSAESLVNTYKRERQKQKLLIRKAKICDAKIVCIKTAFGRLLADENFSTLLKAESLSTMPKCLWEKATNKAKETE